MKLSIKSFGKSHKALVISGSEEKVKHVAAEIDSQRHHYNLDYSDLTIQENGKAIAEFVAHRSHHKKAATFIQNHIRT